MTRLFFFLDLDDLTTTVGSAGWADLVRRFVFVAVVAANEMRQSQLVMSATVVLASARKFALG